MDMIATILKEADELNASLCPDRLVEALADVQDNIRNANGLLKASGTSCFRDYQDNLSAVERKQEDLNRISDELSKLEKRQTARLLENRKFTIKRETTELENNIQDYILKKEALEQDLKKLTFSVQSSEIPPDSSAIKLALYSQFGLSVLSDENGCFTRLQVCPPHSSELHTIFLNDSPQTAQLSSISHSEVFARVNRVWALLSGKAHPGARN